MNIGLTHEPRRNINLKCLNVLETHPVPYNTDSIRLQSNMSTSFIRSLPCFLNILQCSYLKVSPQSMKKVI